MKHASHPAIITRLKRAHGHLAAVLSMFEDGRPASILRSSFMRSRAPSATPSAS